MNLIVDLSPNEEALLIDSAKSAGITPQEMVKRLVTEHLPSTNPLDEMHRRIREWQSQDYTTKFAERSSTQAQTSKTLFEKWDKEDESLSAEERQADEQLWEDYTEAIDNERRTAKMRTLF